MSDAARMVLVVTDDPNFSGQVSELMLRAGVRTLRFSQTRQALELTRNLAPDLVLVHIPRTRMDTGWTCYEMLQSDSTIASIPMLFYAPPAAPVQSIGGAPSDGRCANPFTASDMLIAQISSLMRTAPSICYPAYAESVEERFPTGRDDL
jgi:CheY-like chemotaxis protein